MKNYKSLLKIPDSTSFEAVYAYFSHHPKRKVAIVTAALLGITLFFGCQFTSKVKQIVTEDFNQQQLVLARHAAEQIKHHIHMVKKELTLLSLSPAIQYFEKSFMEKRIANTYESLREEGAYEIRYLDCGGYTTHVVGIKG